MCVCMCVCVYVCVYVCVCVCTHLQGDTKNPMKDRCKGGCFEIDSGSQQGWRRDPGPLLHKEFDPVRADFEKACLLNDGSCNSSDGCGLQINNIYIKLIWFARATCNQSFQSNFHGILFRFSNTTSAFCGTCSPPLARS